MTRSKLLATAALPFVLAVSVSVASAASHQASAQAPTATAQASAQAPPATATPTTPAPHIMVIVDENAAYNHIVGNYQDAPYINKTLLSTYASATKWYAVEHSSSYDYFDLISGADQKGLTKPVSATTKTFVDQLAAKAIPWKAYMEGMPSPCYRGAGNGNYDPGHNPFIGFQSIVNNTSQCKNEDVPYSPSLMTSDLNAASPPAFVWITPNQCDNMHTNCGSNPVAQGDNWLKTTIPAVQATNWYTQGGIIILTWDESATSDGSGGGIPGDNGGHIATLVISKGSSGSYPFAGDHFGTLNGLQIAYGVGCLAASCHSGHGDISKAFSAPVVTSISPSSGPAAGGTSVTINGSNLSGTTAVTFGAAAATITPVSNTQITATSPAGSGTVDVSVTTGNGTSAISAADQFTYTSAPVVTSISPSSGPAAGGTLVTINGSNFSGATAVTFAGKPAAFTIISDTWITATSPGGKSGAANVVVHSAAGISAKTHSFTYI